MLRVSLAPCSPHTVSNDLMVKAAALARQHPGVRLHTHLAENQARAGLWVQGYRSGLQLLVGAIWQLQRPCAVPISSTARQDLWTLPASWCVQAAARADPGSLTLQVWPAGASATATHVDLNNACPDLAQYLSLRCRRG